MINTSITSPQQPILPFHKRRRSLLFAFLLLIILASTLGVVVRNLSAHSSHETASSSGIGQGYWHTHGSQILDAQNRPVRIAGINWFGFETRSFSPQGLGKRNYKDMLNQIKGLGYNTLRLPYSNQLFDKGSLPSGINYMKNPDLRGLSGLQLMDKFVDYASHIGLHIILDQHRPDAQSQSELWYTPAYPESRWIADWQMLARHYQNNPMVIGADLHNEPHAPACWGCGIKALDWRLAAERAGDAILAVNPNWLIFVEGVDCYAPGGSTQESQCYWWGGNLQGVASYPVQLSVAHRLVYSVHDYPASVAYHPWFYANNYPNNLYQLWNTYWGYVYKEGIAPVWVGEFGSKLETASDQEWFTHLINYLGTGANGINWTYWSWNPTSVDTGGILNDDWTTVNQAKEGPLRRIMFSQIITPTSVTRTKPHVKNTPTKKLAPVGVKTVNQVTSGDVALRIYYKVGNPGVTTTNQVMPQLELVNAGKSSINLSDVTIRYWYTLASPEEESYWCDYAVIGCNNISGTFVSLPSPRAGTNAFLEMSFSENAGSLAPNANTGEIQNRFNKNDWSNFNQANDYSYNPHDITFTLTTKVTVYYQGKLVWGNEPGI
jgi:endoglucanase